MKRIILGIIPARGGSKGVKKKNIRELGGIPLMAYTINAALKSRRLSHCIVSTDSKEIAEVAKRYGIMVPELRPRALSHDSAKTSDVVKYEVLKFQREHKRLPDVVVVLQPTSPLRLAKDIDGAIKKFLESDMEIPLASCTNAEYAHPNYVYVADKKKRYGEPLLSEWGERRQEFKEYLIRNGAIYISKSKWLMENNKIFGEQIMVYEMPRIRSINIDTQLDFLVAEAYLGASK